MCQNRVVYHENKSSIPWTTIYGEELINFLSVVNGKRWGSKTDDWRAGLARVIHRKELEESLTRFPLPYSVEYNPHRVSKTT